MTEETDPATGDTNMDLSYKEEGALLSENGGEDGFNDARIPNAQSQERKRNTANELKKPSEHKTKEPIGSEKTSNEKGRKHQREEPPKSAKTKSSPDGKKSHQEKELHPGED